MLGHRSDGNQSGQMSLTAGANGLSDRPDQPGRPPCSWHGSSRDRGKSGVGPSRGPWTCSQRLCPSPCPRRSLKEWGSALPTLDTFIVPLWEMVI